MHRSVRESVCRSVLPCLVLILLVAAVPLPARAADHPGRPVGSLSRSVLELWEAIVSRIVPSNWLEKLGPDMDPNGLTTGSCPQAGCEVGLGNAADLGPEMDPNG